MRVLVVDPSGGVQPPVVSLLSDRGHEVWRHGSVEDALESCGQRAFDLVVLGGGGAEPETLAQCRAVRESTGGRCFVLVVGSFSAGEVRRALAAGADDVVPAGGSADLLEARLAVVEREVDRHRQRARAEEALRESEGRYRQLLESIPDGTMILELDRWRIRYANLAMARMLGRETEDLAGLGVADIHPADRVGEVIRELELFLTDASWRAPVVPCLRWNGEVVWSEINATPIELDGRRCLLGFYRDVTRRVRAEEAVRRAREQLEARFAERSADLALLSAAVDQAAESVVITDVRGEIQYVNRAFERASGVSRRDALGKLPWALFPGPPEPETVQAMIEALMEGGVWTGAMTCRGVEDTPLDFDVTVFPVRDSAGKSKSFVGLLRDVSDERKLEHQLWQAQKMEEIGKLAGGIAHDFNNLLMVIQGTAELLQGRLAGDDPLQRQVGIVLRTSRSAADLTRALLDFARQQVLETTDLELDRLVQEMLPLLRRVLPENIALEHRPSVGLGNVRADRGRLEQVLMNLCVNSRDAMPSGGSITVTTGNVEIGEDYVRSHPWARTGPHVEFVVVDTGCGMDAGTVAQVFKPFFTTKKAGKGTGLGMASVYGIVKQHGGMVDIVSAPGQGTTVRVLLPRVDRQLEATAPEAEGVSGGSETLHA